MHARSVDYLFNEAARVLAEVEDHVWDGRSLPVPVEDIAGEHYGLLIREVGEIALELPDGNAPEPADAKLSGALIPEKAEIWVDATEASREPRRRRYTIAHELGHWELHRGPDQTLCRTGAVDPSETVTDGRGRDPVAWNDWRRPEGEPRIEWEADVFGGALLLPPRLVREVWDREQSVEAIAEAFDCSLSAVVGRWQEHYSFVDR